MVPTIKPIKVWGQGGPNPPKVYMVLEEIGLPYEAVPISFADVKKPEYLAINPNGRMPSIYDPNTDLTLWESGAIVEYLIERYDTEKKLSFEPGTNGAALARQWLFFQTTGQGPYYGQASWFKKFHPEKIPSALDRYVKEIVRVTSVIEGHLSRQKPQMKAGSDGPWLLDDRITYADIAWVSWQHLVTKIIGPEDGYDPDQFPLVKEWLNKMMNRDAIKKVLDAPPVGH